MNLSHYPPTFCVSRYLQDNLCKDERPGQHVGGLCVWEATGWSYLIPNVGPGSLVETQVLLIQSWVTSGRSVYLSEAQLPHL